MKICGLRNENLQFAKWESVESTGFHFVSFHFVSQTTVSLGIAYLDPLKRLYAFRFSMKPLVETNSGVIEKNVV